MNTEQRLRDALDARAGTASPRPDAFGEVRRRAHRRRNARLQALGTAAAVTAVVAGVAVGVGPRGRDGGPPVSNASVSPTATATPSATPSPTLGTSAVGDEEFVAVLADGRLVVASASTGRVTRTITTAANGAEEVRLAADRGSVFLVTGDEPDDCETAVEQVDVGTGLRTPIGVGSKPDASPDGARLVYVTGRCGNASLVVRDLRSGTERRLTHHMTRPDGKGGLTPPWVVDRAVWHADGKRLWVVVAWENSTELRLLDPATATTTDDAQVVETRHLTFDVERRGSDLLYRHTCCYADETGDDLLVLREGDGGERTLLRVRHGDSLTYSAGPGGDLLYAHEGRLYRLDVATGARTDLGEANALARDW